MWRVLCLLLAVVTAGCGGGDSKEEPAIPTAKGTTGTVPPKPTKPSPEQYRVKLETTRGDIVLEVTRKWAPNGSDRFYELVQSGYYENCRFFRVLSGFMVQCGINGDPTVQAKWRDARIPDDPRVESNQRGYVSYAMADRRTAGPHTRTTQFFINLVDNGEGLDRMDFAPFAKVVEGMDVVDSIYSGYGEKPDQEMVQHRGNAYLEQEFPKLDYIKKATIAAPSDKPADKPAAEKK